MVRSIKRVPEGGEPVEQEKKDRDVVKQSQHDVEPKGPAIRRTKARGKRLVSGVRTKEENRARGRRSRMRGSSTMGRKKAVCERRNKA